MTSPTATPNDEPIGLAISAGQAMYLIRTLAVRARLLRTVTALKAEEEGEFAENLAALISAQAAHQGVAA